MFEPMGGPVRVRDRVVTIGVSGRPINPRKHTLFTSRPQSPGGKAQQPLEAHRWHPKLTRQDRGCEQLAGTVRY